MDDYILAVLREQDGAANSQTAERVKEILDKESATAGRKKRTVMPFDEAEAEMEGQAGAVEKVVAEVFASVMGKSEFGVAGKTERNAEETEALQNVLQRMEAVEIGNSGMSGQEEWIHVQRENDVWSASSFLRYGAGRNQDAMEPETLSRFFQRDARRFS